MVKVFEPPGRKDYFDHFVCCCVSLVCRFSGNEAHIPVLMELLTVLPEEIHSRALRLGLNRREEFTQELSTAAPTVLNLMVRENSFVCVERVHWYSYANENAHRMCTIKANVDT